MKATVKSEQFGKAVQTINAVISPRTTLPILGFVHLTTIDGKLAVTATNLEQTITIKLDAVVEEPGTLTLPAKQLAAAMKTVSSEETHIETKANSRTELKAGNSRFVLNGLDPAEFPSTPQVTGDAQSVDQQEFVGALKSVAFAMSSDETRFVINSVLFDINGTQIHVIATDGRRLAKNTITAKTEAKASKPIVPRNAITEIARVFSDKGDLQIRADNERIAIESENCQLVSRLIDGTYPNYEQVIPKTSSFKAELNRKELSDSTLRAAVITTEKANSIRLTFNETDLQIRAETPDIGEVDDKIPCTFNGQPLTIAFNPTFLNDPLKVLPQEKVIIALQDELSPAVLQADNYLYVLMPMRLS